MKNWIRFQDLETQYFTLRRQYETGQITSQQLSATVQHLRIQDNYGNWWSLRPEDGAWLRWNGISWGAAIPLHLKGPQTLVDLVYSILKELFKDLLWKLPISIGAALVVWAAHTALVVGVNGGLAPGENALMDLVLSLQGQLAPGILFWSVLTCLATIILARVVTLGFRQSLQYITETPAWVEYTLSGSEGNVLITLLSGCASALFLGVIVGNRLVNFLLVIMASGALISQDKSLVLWASRLAWSDGRHFLNRPPRPFIPAWGGLFIIGAIFGFMGAVVLPLMPYMGCVGIFLLVGLVTLLVLVGQGNRSLGAWLLLVPLVVLTPPVQTGQVTISDLWIDIAYGILPAWGAFCGAHLGLSLGRWGNGSFKPEPGAVVPAKRESGVVQQPLSFPAPVSPLSQQASPHSSQEPVILKGQPALDILARLGMIKRVMSSQGGSYVPVNLDPQGPVSAVAYFVDEQGTMLSQLAIAYLPPIPVSGQIELEMQLDEDSPPVEAEEASLPSAEIQPDGFPSEAPEVQNDFQPPDRDQDR